MKNKIYRCLLACAVLAGTVQPLPAQLLRTAYFMDKSIVRSNLNPAFQAEGSYSSIPVIGSLGFSGMSNGLVLSDIIYPDRNLVLSGISYPDRSPYTFLDPRVNTKDFLGNVKKNNGLDMGVRTDIFTMGWRHSPDVFWTIGVGIRAEGYLNIPGSLLEFAKAGMTNGKSVYDFSGLKADVRSYLELSAGYSKKIDERLTVGGKLKLLPALGGLRADFDKFTAEMGQDNWKITTHGKLNASVAGLKLISEEDHISDMEFNTPGLAGFGAAVDFGASYKLLDNLTLSGSVLDLGFISWSKGDYAETKNKTFTFNGFELPIGDNESNMDDQLDQLKEDAEQLIQFKQNKTDRSYTSLLSASVLAGAEYSLLDNMIGLGLLSSTSFNPFNVYTELTASANFRPVDWFAATLSYSAIHSHFKTYGIALNFSPKGFNFFLGSDYMISKVTPQFIPVNVGGSNLYLGMSIKL
ncbi:hypothetical protein Barb6XT_00914 [Bacteroidales bacterium Barb6XT]|nr:hypothetical protein Barb6XT_00914 [Bacteroidales bacterium Barb6XT]